MSTDTQPQQKETIYTTPEAAAAAGDLGGLLKMAIAATGEAKETRMLAQMSVGKEGLEATNTAQLYWLAGMYYRSGAAPKDDMEEKVNGQYRPRSEQNVRARLFIKMSFGAELGLKPLQAIQNIAVINNRPCIWGDAAKALVLNSGLCEYIYEREVGEPGNISNPNPNWGFECVTKRKGQDEEVYRFTWAEAKIAGLLDKNQSLYKLYPRRMLMFRARGFRLRDTYPDVLKGLITAEEARDIGAERTTDSTTAITSRDRLAAMLSEGQESDARPADETGNGEERPLTDEDRAIPPNPPSEAEIADAKADPTHQAAAAGAASGTTEGQSSAQNDFDAAAWVDVYVEQIPQHTRAKARREQAEILAGMIEKLGPTQYERAHKACVAAGWIM